ncbi:F-box protein PP2-B15-like [Diospyros lotus]|uniref:F-box protein PP2-B15-like n=1 Tax=Diospyros lotus TaxID=55363 RepID=UPI00224E604C|nr:F-box protein PP2-B15-like [Diospyros lotus]
MAMKFDALPEDCIASILSLTSPPDAGKSSAVSSAVRAAAESDLLWESFLPPDYRDVLSRLTSPVLYRSKKELFLRLCIPRLIDGGTKSFSLERSTSKKCYMLSARELSITWATNSLYWCWKPSLQSRFGEVAELITVCWLEIHGKISTRMLTPNTAYTAYLIVNFADRAYGLDYVPSEVLVEVDNHQSRGLIYLRPEEGKRKMPELILTCNRMEALRARVMKGEEKVAHERGDGWLEVELGEFHNDGSEKDVKMSLKEVKGEHLKGGLIVDGIELRPRC